MVSEGRVKRKDFAAVNWTLGLVMLIVGVGLTRSASPAGFWVALAGTALMVAALIVRRRAPGALRLVRATWAIGLLLLLTTFWFFLQMNDPDLLRVGAVASAALMVTALVIDPDGQATT